MSVEEARAALDKLAWSATCDEDEQAVLMEAADAYALAVHVDACEKMEIGKEGYTGRHCGDDWWCEKAQPYREAPS